MSATSSKLPNPHAPVTMAHRLCNPYLARFGIAIRLPTTERVIPLHLFDTDVIAAQFGIGRGCPKAAHAQKGHQKATNWPHFRFANISLSNFLAFIRPLWTDGYILPALTCTTSTLINSDHSTLLSPFFFLHQGDKLWFLYTLFEMVFFCFHFIMIYAKAIALFCRRRSGFRTNLLPHHR